MKSNKKKAKILGLVGAGYWGKNLIRVFDKLGVLKIICDIDKNVLADRKAKYPHLKTSTNFSEILEDKSIKAVVISTPSVTHYKLCKRALRARKDVFVEKPLALKVKQGKELVRLAQNKKCILIVGHLLLYHPAIVKLKKIIREGKLGEIRYVWSNRLNFGKLRRDENVLWSFAPHDISIIIDLLGMPKRLIAVGKSYLQKEISDTTLTFFEFNKEKTAHIFGSWLNPFKEQKLAVIGSKKMAVFDGVKNELTVYPHKIKRYRNKAPEAIKAKGKIIKTSKKEPLMEEAKHFLECIEKRKRPRTDGEEALAVLRVLDVCQKSLEKGQKLINITW